MDYYSASDVLKTTTFKPASRISKFVAEHVNQEVVGPARLAGFEHRNPYKHYDHDCEC